MMIRMQSAALAAVVASLLSVGCASGGGDQTGQTQGQEQGSVRVTGETAATGQTGATTQNQGTAAQGTGSATGQAQGSASAQGQAGGDQLAAGQQIAEQWLALVDQGRYAESWSATGSLFQANMQQNNWVQALTGARQPLGNVVNRQLTGREARSELPGAPPGQYILVGYETDFQNRADLVETVTLMQEQDGSWKVVGYTATPKPAEGQQGTGTQGTGTGAQQGTGTQGTGTQGTQTPPPAETPPQDPPAAS